jgi:hypothetical protein
MKTIIIVTAGLVAMLSVAAAADLPRKEPPPVAAPPIGKYPVANIRLASIQLANTHSLS